MNFEKIKNFINYIIIIYRTNKIIDLTIRIEDEIIKLDKDIKLKLSNNCYKIINETHQFREQMKNKYLGEN